MLSWSFNNWGLPFMQARCTVAVFNSKGGFQSVVARFRALSYSSNRQWFVERDLLNCYSIFYRKSCESSG